MKEINHAKNFLDYLYKQENRQKTLVVHNAISDPEDHLIISVLSPIEFNSMAVAEKKKNTKNLGYI